MQVKIFQMPISGDEEKEDQMNAFLRGHKIVEVKEEMIKSPVGLEGYWCFLVKYLEHSQKQEGRKGKIDYKEVLDEKAFSVFLHLKECRKQIGEMEALPLYAVFTNAELAEISKKEEFSMDELKKCKNVSKARLEKYGAQLIRLLKIRLENEKSR